MGRQPGDRKRPPSLDSLDTGQDATGELPGGTKRFKPGGDPRDGSSAGPSEGAAGWTPAGSASAAEGDASGRLIHGRYRLIAELGAGGMGITYRAWDTQEGIPVVVKLPRPEVRRNRDVMARFQREIDAMRAVPHESIVPITDSGDDGGCPYVAMRFLPGGSLAEYRRRDESGRPIKNPPGMLHLWLPGVAAALDHIHSRGMLHRDVKPGNIFLDGFLRPFLGDFGIAKVVDDSGSIPKEQTLTATGMAVGTPEYMAPELFQPKPQVDGKADLYALAITVYEMLCGEKPFTGSTAHIIVEHSSLPVPSLDRRCPGLPPGLSAAVKRALSKNPADRFPSCGDFAAAVLADLPAIAPEADTVRLLCPSCRNILKLSQQTAGKRGSCPKCRSVIDVAADLGSLWIEGEERGGGEGADRPADLRAASALVLKEKTGPQGMLARPRAWRPWAMAVAAAIAGLMVGAIWGGTGRNTGVREKIAAEKSRAAEASAANLEDLASQHAEAVGRLETARDEATAALAIAAETIKGLEVKLADSATMAAGLAKEAADRKTQVDTLRAENDRLTKALAVFEAKTAEKMPPVAGGGAADRVTNSIGMTLKRIPAGEFTMGDGTGQPDERPAHKVTISKPFLIGIYEVTNAQWKTVMGTIPSQWKDGDHPVETVSWDEAVSFCQKLSEVDAERQAGRVYRLPTEAEWEYACRAGTQTRYSFGDDANLLGDFAWFARNSGQQTHVVGQKKPNAWGLYDMHGNVWEWCADWYADYGGQPQIDPQGPPAGSFRVSRGGCWFLDSEYCRSAPRHVGSPSYRYFNIGFRVVALLGWAVRVVHCRERWYASLLISDSCTLPLCCSALDPVSGGRQDAARKMPAV